MSTLKSNVIEPATGTTLTLGASGDLINVPSDALQLNTWKDSGGNTLFTSDGSGNVYKGSVQFLSKWTDDEGRVYAQCKVTLEEGMAWDTLSRVSADGKTLEVQPDATEIDTNNSRYSIYYLR